MNRERLAILSGAVIIAAGLLVVSGQVEGGANIHPNTRELEIEGIKYTIKQDICYILLMSDPPHSSLQTIFIFHCFSD